MELSNIQLKDLELPRAQDELKELRKEWTTIANRQLQNVWSEACIDHRSHADRRLDLLPIEKLRWEGSAIERKGIKIAIGDYNRIG
ncbi:MobA/MobL family protein [Psychrobacter urativorans]|nr:MobA/MobL family protein [Psychrobacter urativorans]